MRYWVEGSTFALFALSIKRFRHSDSGQLPILQCNQGLISLLFSLQLLPEDAAPPSGCAMSTVGSACEVYIRLVGLVDAANEIARLKESIDKCCSQRDKLLLSTKVDGYREKVALYANTHFEADIVDGCGDSKST